MRDVVLGKLPIDALARLLDPYPVLPVEERVENGQQVVRDTDDTDVNGIKKNIMKKNIEQDGFILVKRKTKHTRKYVEPTNEQNVAKDKRIVSWSLT
jgi:hypothetical protein